MYNWQLPLALTLKELGIESLVVFDRKLAQRYVYLLQSVGYPLKYGFAWSFIAPYSDDLMEDVYDIVPHLDGIPSDAHLTEPCAKVIGLLRKLDESREKYNFQKLQWLDMLVARAYGNNVDDHAKNEYASFKRKAKKILEKKKTVFSKRI